VTPDKQHDAEMIGTALSFAPLGGFAQTFVRYGRARKYAATRMATRREPILGQEGGSGATPKASKATRQALYSRYNCLRLPHRAAVRPASSFPLLQQLLAPVGRDVAGAAVLRTDLPPEW
jgi:hypothetical protein